MYSRVSATLLAVALSSSGFAQRTSPLPEVATGAPQDHYPSVQVTFPNGVNSTPGLVYGRPVGYRPLTLDLYTPPPDMRRPPSGFPLIVYVHGGAWMLGGSRFFAPFVDFPGVLASLAAKGYVVAAVDYRLSGEATFPAPIQDVKAAIRWLRSRASEYAIDPTRAMTWGGSAGGHLAALAALSCNVQALEPAEASAISDCVQGSVAWFGVFDINTLIEQGKQDNVLTPDATPEAPEWRLLGCFSVKCKPGQISAASPVTYVTSKSPPMLLIVGTADRSVPYHQSLEMAEKLKSAGATHEIIVLPGVGHNLIGNTLEQTRDANLKALDATFRFIYESMSKHQ